MDQRFLVTGGGGFIGRHVIRRLLPLGGVHALDRNATRHADGVESILVDLTDARAVGAVVRRIQPTAVIHLAASGVMPGADDVGRMVATNVVGTRNLLAAIAGARGLEAAVVLGSWFEYGAGGRDGAPSPSTPYGVTKLAATMLAGAARSEGVPTVVLRPFQVYGPGEPAHRLIPALLERARAGEALTLRQAGIRRDWVFVEDVAEAVVRATSETAEGGPFDIGTGRSTSVGEVARLAAALVGAPGPIEAAGTPPAGDEEREGVADVAAAARCLGWRARHDLQQGLTATIDHWRRTPLEAPSA
ncbi:MAG: NAD(P)-dependent oxidoreductase [Vicinamibacterales bacterium]